MRLIRFGPAGAELPGLVDAGGLRRDATAFGEDWGERFFGSNGLHRLHTWLAVEGAGLPVVADALRWGPPIARPSKIVCIGLNYRDHAREIIAPPPTEPILFAKATSSSWRAIRAARTR